MDRKVMTAIAAASLMASVSQAVYAYDDVTVIRKTVTMPGTSIMPVISPAETVTTTRTTVVDPSYTAPVVVTPSAYVRPSTTYIAPVSTGITPATTVLSPSTVLVSPDITPVSTVTTTRRTTVTTTPDPASIARTETSVSATMAGNFPVYSNRLAAMQDQISNGLSKGWLTASQADQLSAERRTISQMVASRSDSLADTNMIEKRLTNLNIEITRALGSQASVVHYN